MRASSIRWNAASHLSKGFKQRMYSVLCRGFTEDEHRRWQSVIVEEKRQAEKRKSIAVATAA